MAEPRPDTLRRLAGELRAEGVNVDRTVGEMDEARRAVKAGGSKLGLYAAAALLDTFYTGAEKAFARVAAVMGGVPTGPSWHRTLLEDMSLDLPSVRPPVVSAETVRNLESFLAFRHRFRNLYLFDLEAERVLPLLEQAGPVWSRAHRELLEFVGRLEGIAEGLERA